MNEKAFYISTDSNEVKVIVERPYELQKVFSLVRDYDFSEDVIRVNGISVPIANIPMEVGEKIKKREGLFFNPVSVILAKLDPEREKNLIQKLVREGVVIAKVDGRSVEHSFPTKYDGYQGGDIF